MIGVCPLHTDSTSRCEDGVDVGQLNPYEFGTAVVVGECFVCVFFVIFFFNETATTEIYTRSLVGSVRCV